MGKAPFLTPEMKAGLFLTFCLALLLSFFIFYGKLARRWGGRREIAILFVHASNLRPDARVTYNGMEIGRVTVLRNRLLDEETLARFPVLNTALLPQLPLSDDERQELETVPEARQDAEIRRRLLGRQMAELILTVREEGDRQRFRQDDQVRIMATLMGDCTVMIYSGSGAPLPEEQAHYLLGLTGDMFSDFSRSLDQIRDILGATGAMIGGDTAGEGSALNAQTTNFSRFTERLEKLSGTLARELLPTWETLDRKIESGRESLRTLGKNLVKVRPELEELLGRVEKSLTELRRDNLRMLDDGLKQVRDFKAEAEAALNSLRERVAGVKRTLPIRIHDAREWTDRRQARVERIEAAMTAAERSVAQGLESLRQMLRELRTTADAIEEKLWYLAQHPEVLTATPSDIHGLYLDALRRSWLLGRHYLELRKELEQARAQARPSGSTDQARLRRIRQILEEMDGLYPAPAATAPAAPGRRAPR